MDRIAEIRERLEKATPGVWRTVEKGNSIPSIAVETLAYVGEPSIKICSGISPKTKNAEFIAHAHEDIPYLLGVIEQQQADLKALKEQLADYEDIVKSLIVAGEWINDMTYESFDQSLIHRAKILIEKIEG